jgi:hypothetical protein
MKRIIFILLVLTSCGKSENREDINCKYQGGIIYQVYPWETVGVCYDILYKGEILTYVNGFEIHKGYNVGDTINKPCLK